MFPEQGCSHAEKVEWVVGVTKESGERRAGQGISAWGWRESHAGSEGAVDRVVVQVDADAMSVLGMLKQEPGAGEGLLTGSADVAGWLIFICGPRERQNCKNQIQIKYAKKIFTIYTSILLCLHVCK